MIKRVFSSLLAAIILVSTAFAADGSVPAAEASAVGTQLTFTVTLPAGTDTMTSDLAGQLQTVLGNRLDQLALDDAAVALSEDGMTVTIALPEGADVPDDLAAFLTQTNALSITDAEGKVSLTRADITAAEAGQSAEADGAPAYIQLTPSDEAQTALGELTEDDTLSVTLDGAAIGETAAYSADDAALTVTGGLDLNTAKLYVARIMAGTLPVALTQSTDTPEQPVQPEEPEQPAEPVEPTFPDIAGHWAEQALNTGVSMGLINGVDGMMLPNDAVKRSEAIVMLNRALGATIADNTSSLSGTPSNAWYAGDLGKAIHLGLISANDSRNFDVAATRAEAFEWLARAFAFDRAETGADELSVFTDTASMTAAQQRAAAALVAAGVVNGDTPTTLAPQSTLTRAQFITMITRVADRILEAPAENTTEDTAETPAEDTTETPTEDTTTTPAEDTAETPTEDTAETPAEDTAETPTEDTAETPVEDKTLPTGHAIVALPETSLSGVTLTDDLIFSVPAQSVSLDAVTTRHRIVLKGAEQTKLNVKGGSSIAMLAVDPAGTANITLSGDTALQTLTIAGTGGAVSVSGPATNIEITASNRTIYLSDMQAEMLTVTGSGNTIVVDGMVGAAAINGGAKNNHLTLNQPVDSVLVAGIGSTVDGSGKATTVDIRAVNCEVSLAADSKVENIDPGLNGVTVQMTVPEKVKAGGSLVTTVTFSGVSEDKICSAQWYKDGQAMTNYHNSSFELTNSASSSIRTYFTFTQNMKTSVTMGFKLTYNNPSTGETEEKYVEKTVPIENYSAEWYHQRDVNRILNLVSSTYRGNYTTSYAVNNDYKAYEKEIWVNAKGYSSNSKYLIWVNRAYPHANVFQGSKGNWKLVKSFLVGIGAPGTPTPTGVTTISYKSAGGWTTSTYTVRPVVGFYPGTGYAFHSRLCYPGTDTEYDFSAGYPVSHGCVRMYKNDVKWIYNNVPVGTTVVIY